jgi:hypothetical protein
MDRDERSEPRTALRWTWWAVGVTCWSLFLHFGITSIEAYVFRGVFPEWAAIPWAAGMYVSGNVGAVVCILALRHVVTSTVVRRRGLVLALLIGCMLENLMAAGSIVAMVVIGIFGV